MSFMSYEEWEALEKRVASEWDNGTFLGQPEDRDAAWVRSAMCIAWRSRILSDSKSHSLGILANVLHDLKTFFDGCDMMEDPDWPWIDAESVERLWALRKLVNW